MEAFLCDAAFWPHSAPVLFPFVGALRENCARAEQGEVRAGRHGIARISDFGIVSRSARHVTLGLSSCAETKTCYPYDFRLEVSFGVDGLAVAIGPWTGTATRTDEDDVFKHKQGVMLLAPGCSDQRAFRMRPIVS